MGVRSLLCAMAIGATGCSYPQSQQPTQLPGEFAADSAFPSEDVRHNASQVDGSEAAAQLQTCMDAIHTMDIDLSAYDTAIKAQYGGRCSAYGLVAAMENKANQGAVRLSEKKLDLSETHQFWTQHFNYSSPVAILKATTYPIMEERYWVEQNYDGFIRVAVHRFFGKPDLGAVEGLVVAEHKQIHKMDDLDSLSALEICQGLLELQAKNPLYMALSSNSSLYAMDSPVSAEPVPGNGHAVAAIGYKVTSKSPLTGYFKIKNSWGTKAGNVTTVGLRPGYQAVPFAYCTDEKQYCGLWAIRAVKKKKIELDGKRPVR